MLLDWYYKIWVDGIRRIQSVPQSKADWKYYTMIFISMAMALQLGLIITLLEMYVFHSNFYRIDINIFPGEKLDYFLAFFILYLLPSLILNYFLIFFNNRYEKILKKYEYKYDGILYVIYTVGTFIFTMLLVVSIFIYQSITL